MFFYDVFPTPAGWIAAVASTDGLVEITLPQKTEARARRAPGNNIEKATRTPERFSDLAERLVGYFTGRKVDFPYILDFSGATPFQRQVWEATRLIPYGQTRSYRWVAAQIGKPKAFRAVGQALGRNPLPVIIPCHRVLASDGGPGGYSGGIEMKKRLLEMEGSGKVKDQISRITT